MLITGANDQRVWKWLVAATVETLAQHWNQVTVHTLHCGIVV